MCRVLPPDVVNMIMDNVAGLQHRNKFTWIRYSIIMVGSERFHDNGSKRQIHHMHRWLNLRPYTGTGFRAIKVAEAVYRARDVILPMIKFMDRAAWSEIDKHHNVGILWVKRQDYLYDG